MDCSQNVRDQSFFSSLNRGWFVLRVISSKCRIIDKTVELEISFFEEITKLFNTFLKADVLSSSPMSRHSTLQLVLGKSAVIFYWKEDIFDLAVAMIYHEGFFVRIISNSFRPKPLVAPVRIKR